MEIEYANLKVKIIQEVTYSCSLIFIQKQKLVIYDISLTILLTRILNFCPEFSIDIFQTAGCMTSFPQFIVCIPLVFVCMNINCCCCLKRYFEGLKKSKILAELFMTLPTGYFLLNLFVDWSAVGNSQISSLGFFQGCPCLILSTWLHSWRSRSMSL